MKNTEKLFYNDNKGFLLINIGKSFKGKSYMTRYLLQHMFKSGRLKFGLVFTPTKFNNDYAFLPEKCIIEGYDEEILKIYIENLKQLKENNKGIIEPSFILFEDVSGILNNQSNFFINFIATFRHLNINIIINVQYLLGKNCINTIMREQCSHCIMFNSRTKRTLDALYENFGGLFDSFNLFKQYFFNITKQKYTAMLYLEREDDINNNYIAIKAPSDFEINKIEF